MHLVLLVGAEGGGGRTNDGQAGRARGHRRRLRHREESRPKEGAEDGGDAQQTEVSTVAPDRCEKAVEGSRKSCGAAADAAIVLVRLPLAGDFSNMPLQELGGCSKTRSYVQGHRNVYRMDATFAFLSYLKHPAHGYALIPFSV
jgi:hypothetical protein